MKLVWMADMQRDGVTERILNICINYADYVRARSAKERQQIANRLYTGI